jgi:hypothetical protein
MFIGQVMDGGCVSLTVTVKPHVATLLEASVAVQLTIVVPLLKVDWLGGVQTRLTPGQLSVARFGE